MYLIIQFLRFLLYLTYSILSFSRAWAVLFLFFFSPQSFSLPSSVIEVASVNIDTEMTKYIHKVNLGLFRCLSPSTPQNRTVLQSQRKAGLLCIAAGCWRGGGQGEPSQSGSRAHCIPSFANLSLFQRDSCALGAEQGLFFLALEQPVPQTLRTHFLKLSGTVGSWHLMLSCGKT